MLLRRVAYFIQAQSVFSPLPEGLSQIFRDPLSRTSMQELHWLLVKP